MVKPETVIAWHGKGFRLYWKWQSRYPLGRHSVLREVIDLIQRMSLANPAGGRHVSTGNCRSLDSGCRRHWLPSTLRVLTLIDEYTRKCPVLRVARQLNNYDLIETLADVMLPQRVPEHTRSDDGPGFVARKLEAFLEGHVQAFAYFGGVQTSILYGSPRRGSLRRHAVAR
jgi:hypothetical protein